jgi:SAM-dependent methyltransferase
MPIYEQIGKSYDLTRRADPYIIKKLAHHIQIKQNANYLDVACGTGNYTLALAKYGGYWHGIDHSQQMINTACQKSNSVNWQVADAEVLPFGDGTFSGVLCTLAIHHFDNLIPVFQEIYRVLSTGKLVLFTATPEQMKNYWLVEYFPEAIHKSAQQMPSLETVSAALRAVGFDGIETEPYFVTETLEDLFLYSGKHRPNFYLDANIRSGISTFASRASQKEIESGCKKLKEDISTGLIFEIMEKYQYDKGDYLFAMATVTH